MFDGIRLIATKLSAANQLLLATPLHLSVLGHPLVQLVRFLDQAYKLVRLKSSKDLLAVDLVRLTRLSGGKLQCIMA